MRIKQSVRPRQNIKLLLNKRLAFMGLIYPLAVYSHGGLSSLEGLFELFVVAIMGIVIGLVWLIFTGVIVFSKNNSVKRLKWFRGTVLALIGISLVVLGLMTSASSNVQWPMIKVWAFVAILFIVFTESVIFLSRNYLKEKSHK